jgi:streptogramin lyase
MKTAAALTVIIAVMCLSGVRGAGNDGRWYKPFAAEVGLPIVNAVGAGTCIWFLNGRGVGRFHTATNTTDFYRFDSLALSGYFDGYDMAAADSGHVALFDKEDGQLILFDGKTWHSRRMSGGYEDVAFAANGDLWIASGDTCLIQVVRNSGSWEFVSLGMPDTVHISSLAFDAGGTLWFVGQTEHAYVIGPDSLNTPNSRRLYRFDGTSSHEVAIGCGDPEYLDIDASGNVWFYGDSTVYSVKGDTVRRAFSKPMHLNPAFFRPVFDSDGNLWYTDYATFSVTRIDSRSSEAWTDGALLAGLYYPLAACRDGVYCPKGNGFICYPGNDTASTVITGDIIWGDRCGSPDHVLLFRKDGTMLAQTTQLSSTYPIIEYNHGRCQQHSSPQEAFARMIERADGTLLAGGALSGNLYHLVGETWTLLPGSERFTLASSFGEDSNGRIWGVQDAEVVHESSSGWEIINASNSDLPSFLLSDVNGARPVVKDGAGKIWMQLDSLVVATSDGRHWTVFDKNSLGMQSGHLIRVFERKGTIVAAGFAGCSGTECSDLIRCVWNGSDWRFDTLHLPFTVPANGYYFEDKYGDSWLSVFKEASFVIYRHTDSSWIRYDRKVIPFRIATIIGDDPDGKLYFEDTAHETVVFDRGVAGTITPAAAHPVSSAVSVGAFGMNSLRTEFTLQRTSLVHLALFSLDGRLAQRMFTEWYRPGRHCRTSTVTGAPGIYIARLHTEEGSAVSRFVRQ